MNSLEHFERASGALPGLATPGCREALVGQLVDSERRAEYFEELRLRPGGARGSDPKTAAFNPLRAAILNEQNGNRDEAFWLVFLFVHFGKHRRSGWRLIADIYGRLGSGTLWSWNAVVADVQGLRYWLDNNLEAIRAMEPRRGFGNHRKYESLGAWTDNGTGAVVESYVNWVGKAGHDARIVQIFADIPTPLERFDALYDAVRGVHRFGRTAAFDYCSTVAKLGLSTIEPSAACLAGATGPLRGARLLFCQEGQTLGPAALEAALAPLKSALDVGFDVLEDALCNWQKSPREFKSFRG